MARKDVLHAVLDAAANLGASYTSPATVITYTDNVSYQIVAGAGATGTWTVQGSNDYKPAIAGSTGAAGNWATLTLSANPTLAGSADTILIDLRNVPYVAIRLVYTRTSGTGTAVITIVTKQVGG